MTEPLNAHADTVAWQPLPTRARLLFVLAPTLPLFFVSLFPAFTLSRLLDVWAILPALPLLAAALGAWIGTKQYRHTWWRLDDDGLAIRRGRLWQRETRVPATRVQHLDIKRGPLQRSRGLATLVVHTAGTRHSAVTVPNLDAGDAERLRDRLGRQIDHDDDA
ncbi:PH domain-containing protein [Lysobacter panacisoli]|uniref:PH domain-containing protein n=1 Tax=Lysobacter panacisoli TaxID=1255263 RepID=A0ABP9KZS6_9GAMM|nr:PH domain-containing protein [Lysobacter panacisoli]